MRRSLPIYINIRLGYQFATALIIPIIRIFTSNFLFNFNGVRANAAEMCHIAGSECGDRPLFAYNIVG